MVGTVIGLRYADWKRWYDGKATEIQTAQNDAAKERKQLQQSQGNVAATNSSGQTSSPAP
jgi:hypothetical protein